MTTESTTSVREAEREAALERIKRLAEQPPYMAVIVCDGCRACYPDDKASDGESCDVCGRFKQRMEFASGIDVAKDACRALGIQISEETTE